MDTFPESPPRARVEIPEGAYEVARLSGELLHDLNNALVTLSALTEMADAEAREGRSTLASIDRIRTACGQLRRVVRDVSDAMLGRSTSGEVEFDPCAAARAAYDQWIITAPPLDISFNCDLPPAARVRGRESFFARALSNLLRNAARHAKGEVRVRIRPAAHPSGAGMVLSVEDDGAGIEETLEHRMFDPFVHGGHGGAGLGLSMVRWAAEQLGGTAEITDRSLLGGAHFLLLLPLRCAPAPFGDDGGSSARLPLTGRRIVVVDDDAAIRQLYTRLLRTDGAVAIELAPAEYPSAELMAIQISSAAADVILMDADMGSLSGLAVWQALQSLSPAAANRTLFVSGHVPELIGYVPELTERWIVKDAEWAVLRAAVLNLLSRET